MNNNYNTSYSSNPMDEHRQIVSRLNTTKVIYSLRDEEEDESYEMLKQQRLARKRRLYLKQKKENDEEKLNKCKIILQQRIVHNVINTIQIMNYDVLFCIYNGGIQHMEATLVRRRSNDGRTERQWWTIVHPSLTGEPPLDSSGRAVRESTFKEHYRVTLSTFELLVNELSETEQYANLSERDTNWPVWKQVAVVMWRFSNTHFGYRMAKEQFGCSHGSYNNFTDRFIGAMSTDIMNRVITWPTTVRRTRSIANGFAKDTQKGHRRLEKVIGAIDGKLFSIHKPSKANDGDRYADRKGGISMSLMAVCDDQKRFINILTGLPGKFTKWSVYVLLNYHDVFRQLSRCTSI